MQPYRPRPVPQPFVIPILGANRRQRRKIVRALQLLRAAVPDEYAHLTQAIVAIRVEVGACGHGSLACTAGRFGRVAVLSVDPLTRPLVDVAVTLSHEARHHGFDYYEGWFVIEHTCTPRCGEEPFRSHDMIYQRDAVVRRRLLRFVRAAPRRRPRVVPVRPRPRPSPPPGWGKVVLGAAVVGLGVVGVAAFTNRA